MREDLIALHVHARAELGRVGFVGDDAHRARLGACAVERALRALEDLDALNVVDVNVDVAVDGRDRLLVEVLADARLRARMVRPAARDTADVDVGLARLAVPTLPLTAHVGDARRELHVVVDSGDVELIELRGVEHLDADRHVLQVLDALLRGHHDFLEAAGCRTRTRRRRCLLGVGGRHRYE